MEIPRTLVMKAAEIADLGDDSIQENYRGRGMYGASCFGIVGSMRDLTRFMVALTCLEMQETDETSCAENLADNVATDSMGYSTIFYFPGIKLSEV